MIEPHIKPGTFQMGNKRTHQYYVVELSYPIYKDEKFICVPRSWVFDIDNQKVVVRYPRCPIDELLSKMKLDTYEDNDQDWMMLAVYVKLKTNSYKHAINYINYINRNHLSKQTRSTEEYVSGDEPVRSERNSGYSTPLHSEYPNCDILKALLSDQIPLADQPPLPDVNGKTNEIINNDNEVETNNYFDPNDSAEPRQSSYQPETHSPSMMEHSAKSSNDDFEKSVNCRKIKENNAYHYTPELTNKPLMLKIIRKPMMPSITKPPAIDSNINILKQQSCTTENELGSLKNSSKELSKYLTQTVHDLSTFAKHNDQNTLQYVRSSDKSDCGIEKEANSGDHGQEKESVENGSSGFTREPTLNAILSSELVKLHSRLDELFRRYDENRCDNIKINSGMEVLAKKVAELEQLYTESSTASSVEIENMEEEVIETIEDEIEKNKRARYKENIRKKVKNQAKRRRNGSDGFEDIPKKKSSCRFILPQNYDRDDSRWTLKYREMDDDLIELIENTGIYVNESILCAGKRLSKDSKEYAIMLLLEIFSVSALSTCTLTGAKASSCRTEDYEVRPGLDKKARFVLLASVERHAREKRWARLHTRREIMKHRKDIMTTLRNKMTRMRKLNKLHLC
ncbi:uncharacterized protein LOC120631495 isoform X1 [Pararge aegeria]|uniref:uncharacterized protein LOC120631495 isoform X1 n=2 Tax=Pararge aegeria TaxID=116150 RepID=UPI0019D24ADB|nr:uncharacterized protein LOC120631495 isoform X1 [Pararge aegeria]